MAVEETVSCTCEVLPCASVEVRVIVLCTTVVAWVTSLGVTTAVVDSMTVDPCDVTTAVSTVVVTDGASSDDDDDGGGGGFEEGAADSNVVAAAASDVDDTPVDRLTCRFSSFASAASISLAGTAEAAMMAKRRNVDSDHGCILKIVFERIDLVYIGKVV